MNKFDEVEVGLMQRWYISVPFATVQCNTVQETDMKRIAQIAPIFQKFESKDFRVLLQWLAGKCGHSNMTVELL